jgi:diguanylate cyclase (GGDEF)-like protein
MSSRSADEQQAETDTLRAQIAALQRDLARERAERLAAERLLDQRDRELGAFHQTALALLQSRAIEELLRTIVTSAAGLLGTEHGFLYLVDQADHVLVTRIGIGRHSSYDGYRLRYGEGLSGKVWATGQPIVVPDYTAWPDRVRDLQPPYFRAILAVPLLRQREVLGVLGLSFNDDSALVDAQSVRLLERFAQLAALALDNAQLYTEAQREIADRARAEEALRESERQLRDLYHTSDRQAQELVLLSQVRAALARELELDPLFQTVVESVAQVYGYTHVSLYMREGETLLLRHQVGYNNVIASVPIAHGITGRVVRTAQPLLLADVRSDPSFLGAIEGIVSEVAVPLFDEGRAIGVLNVESSDGVQLGDQDLRLVEALAEHISIAISRARIHNAVQRQVRELDALRTTMTEILANLDLDKLLSAILVRQVTLLDATSGELALYDPRSDDLLIVAGHNIGRDSTGVHQPLGEGIMGIVALTRAPLVVPNYHLWSGRILAYEGLGPSTALAVPMLAGDQLIGVLGVGDIKTSRVFTEADQRLLSLFAQQATVAIQNARLFAEAQHLSISDPLTGLANRRHFFALARHELDRAQRYEQKLAVIMLDIDDFKRINDSYGHAAGDMALQAIGSSCHEALRTADLIARYGGEELVVMLPDTSLDAAIAVAERLRSVLAAITAVAIPITASIGVAIFDPHHPIELDALIDRADRAQYIAKRAGKDRVSVWEPDGAAVDQP